MGIDSVSRSDAETIKFIRRNKNVLEITKNPLGTITVSANDATDGKKAQKRSCVLQNRAPKPHRESSRMTKNEKRCTKMIKE